jgi:predicted ArsR family transcriptional regulator
MADLNKEKILKEIKDEIHAKMEDEERNKILTGIYGRIISTLAKRLIQFEGYSVVNTLIKREMREIGRHDAAVIAEAFGLKKTPEDMSKALKISATLIGYNLDIEAGETIVKACPFANMAKEMKEPTLCNICTEYVNGVTEGMLGSNFEMIASHDITHDTPHCFFRLKKKS